MHSFYRIYVSVFIGTGIFFGACSEGRNPFALPHQHKQAKKNRALVLEGIVQCSDKQCAVLSNGTQREMVPLKGNFDGYTIKEMGKDFVVVRKNEHVQKICIE